MRACPNCKHEQPENATICSFCGALLVNEAGTTATRTLDDTDYEEGVPRWGTARFNDRMNLVLTVRDAAERFVYDADDIQELIIGRRDPHTGDSPALDLQAFGAIDKGVSRRHAAIIRRDGALSIVDKGTPNGTYLNGQRLIPNQPRILRDGDDLRLGHLVLHVRFERVATTT